MTIFSFRVRKEEGERERGREGEGTNSRYFTFFFFFSFFLAFIKAAASKYEVLVDPTPAVKKGEGEGLPSFFFSKRVHSTGNF